MFFCSFNRPKFRFRGDSETTKELRLARISLCIVWLFIFCHVWKLIPTVYETFFMDVSVNSTTDDWPGRSSKQPKRSDREGQWMPPPITTFGLWVIIIKPKQYKNTIKVCVVLWPHLTVSHFSVVPENQRTILHMIVRLRDLERRHISSKSHSRVQDWDKEVTEKKERPSPMRGHWFALNALHWYITSGLRPSVLLLATSLSFGKFFTTLKFHHPIIF